MLRCEKKNKLDQNYMKNYLTYSCSLCF